MSLIPNVSTAIITLLICFVLYFLYFVVVKPKLRMQFFKAQGFRCQYFPILGEAEVIFRGLKENGDSEHYYKSQCEGKPQRVECWNDQSRASITLFEPALIKAFSLNTENYVKDTAFLELYFSLLGRGLVTSEGARWKAQRKLLSNVFNFEYLKLVLPTVKTTVHQGLNDIKSTSLQNVNIMDVFQRITGETVGKIFFGAQLNHHQVHGQPLTITLASLIADVGTLTLSPERMILGDWILKKGILPKHRKLNKRIEEYRKICVDIIEERKKQPLGEKPKENRDILDILLEFTDEEGKIKDEEIIDQFTTFFVAGMDTTGHLVTMAVYYLDKYPEYQAKMREEIDEYFGEGQDVTVSDLNKLEFMMAFLKETLRIATPARALFPRIAVRNHTINDVYVRKGHVINVNYFYNHYNPTYFPDPYKFDPHRWLNNEKLNETYAFIPFSAGPRNCIGQHLALLEARIMLCDFLKMYDFKVKEGYQLRMTSTFLYEPEESILLDLTAREV